jgi:hypothetical protein
LSPPPDPPSFTRDFPKEPRLDALVRAFADGDYARVRREVPALVQATDDDAVKTAAEELVRRTTPDRQMVMLLALTGALLVLLSVYWFVHGR